MTNRTREVIDFVQLEPLAVDDVARMIRYCDEEEVQHIEHVSETLRAAIDRLDDADFNWFDS